MGIIASLEKTALKFMNYVGLNKKTIKTGLSSIGIFSLTKSSAASIGGVMDKIFTQNDYVGDTVELSTNKEAQKSSQTAAPESERIDTKSKTAATQKSIKSGTTAPKTTTNKKTKTDKNTKDLSSDVNKLKIALRQKCQESNINFGELIVNLAALTGKTIMEFNKLDNNLQLSLLSYVMESIERVNKANLPGVKKLEAVVTDAAMMYHFVTHDKNGNIIDIEKMTPEELKKRREVCEIKLRQKKEEKLAEINKLPESERAAAEEALKEELAEYRKHIFDELSKKIPFECALELILIVSSKDLGKAAKELMESYPIEIREKIANTMQTFESFKEYINIAKGRGEDLGDEKALAAFEQYHKIFGTYKTNENLINYENEFVEARKNGELTDEITRATAMGIGEAAYSNINMTTEQKESFIKNWSVDNSDILSAEDFIKVEKTAKEYIKEIIEKNPEVKGKIATVEKSVKEIVEKTLTKIIEDKKESKAEKDEKKEKQEQELTYEELSKILNTSSAKIGTIEKEVLTQAQIYLKKLEEKLKTPAIKKTPEEIGIALLKGYIDEKDAIKNLDNSEHKFIKMCVKNHTLASLYERRIDLYIKSEKDEDKLKELAAVAPHDIVLKIVHNMRGNKEKLSQELIAKHEVDFNTKVKLEQYTNKKAA